MVITRKQWETAGWTLLIFVLFVVTLRLMGRISFCECGLGLWTGNPAGSDTSQLFADPYSWSHFLHGIIFYWVARKVFPRLKIQHWFLLALITEVGWEIWENTPFIINRYRETTAALGYTGDSIFNSLGDVCFMMIGFAIAHTISWRWAIGLFFVVELIMLLLYRDNLTLNVLMLIYPIDVIREWQMGL